MSTDPVEQRQTIMIIAAVVGLLLALMVGLFVYLQKGGDDTPAAETTSSPTVESTPSEDTETDEEEDDRGDLPGQDDIDEASKESAPARKVATKVIEEMANTDQSTKEWRSSVAPLFTKEGRSQINSMAPKDVQFSKRTGPANLILSESGQSKTQFPIAVDTDKGMWMVLVVEDDDDKWRALSVTKYDDGTPEPSA